MLLKCSGYSTHASITPCKEAFMTGEGPPDCATITFRLAIRCPNFSVNDARTRSAVTLFQFLETWRNNLLFQWKIDPTVCLHGLQNTAQDFHGNGAIFRSNNRLFVIGNTVDKVLNHFLVRPSPGRVDGDPPLFQRSINVVLSPEYLWIAIIAQYLRKILPVIILVGIHRERCRLIRILCLRTSQNSPLSPEQFATLCDHWRIPIEVYDPVLSSFEFNLYVNTII